MAYRIGPSLLTILILVGCATTDVPDNSWRPVQQMGNLVIEEPRQTVLGLKLGADCPGTTLGETNVVLCLFEYPTIDAASQQTIIRLSSGADCPGIKFDGYYGGLCLIEYPKGWQPFEHDGLIYYKIQLAKSKG